MYRVFIKKSSPRGRRGCLRKLPLNELSAPSARDPRREIDLLDRQRLVLAERTRRVAGTARGDLIQHVLPGDQLFLVHRRVLSFQGFRQTSDILGKRASWRQRARVRITRWRGGKGRSSVELAPRHQPDVAALRRRDGSPWRSCQGLPSQTLPRTRGTAPHGTPPWSLAPAPPTSAMQPVRHSSVPGPDRGHEPRPGPRSEGQDEVQRWKRR